MKVAKLIKRLSKLDQQLEVLISRDEEGNGFNMLAEVQQCFYDPDDIEVYADEDREPWMKRAVILWP